jgi:ABC-2 type transport system permease protein
MSPWRQIFEVARRDFMQRARSRAFLITTALTVAVIFGTVPLLASQIRQADATVVGIVGTESDLASIIESTGSIAGFPIRVESYDSEEDGASALVDGDVAALVVAPDVVRYQSDADARLTSVIETAVVTLRRDEAISRLGLTPEEAEAVVSPPGVTVEVMSPPAADDLPRRIGAQFGAILMYMAILVFGQFIMLGVMEEKQSRVVEVVLSRVRATRLLTGKILGIGLLGLSQLVIIGTALVVAVVMVDIPGIDLPSLGAGILMRTVLWFLLGFGMYAVLYGALGATVTRQEDSQGAAILPALLLVPGYFISFVAIESPNGALAIIGSLVPFTAPVVMPVRAATGAVPSWQVALAVVLVVITTVVVIRIGARVYRGAVLSIGAKVKVREALRRSRTAA